jgi:hypothetical protein
MLDAIDGLIDELVPEGLDWQRLVRDYPIPALLLAAAGGFWLGRTRGPQVLTAVTGFASAEIAKSVTQLMDQAG